MRYHGQSGRWTSPTPLNAYGNAYPAISINADANAATRNRALWAVLVYRPCWLLVGLCEQRQRQGSGCDLCPTANFVLRDPHDGDSAEEGASQGLIIGRKPTSANSPAARWLFFLLRRRGDAMGETNPKTKQRRKSRQRRDERVTYAVEIKDWEWSFWFGINSPKDRFGDYSDYRHLHLHGILIAPKKVSREVAKCHKLTPSSRWIMTLKAYLN